MLGLLRRHCTLMMDRPFRFCILLTLGMAIPIGFLLTPLYIRHHVYGKYHIPVTTTESRIVDHKISTFWCEAERISINTTFNAYLMSEKPHYFENSTRTFWTTKHFQLRSEEREYWGLYLPKNSVLSVSLCARYEGAKVVIYKGKRNMKTCVKHEDNDEGEEEMELSDEDDDYITDDDLEETLDEDSSVSSSDEEFFNDCHGALFNQTLIPSPDCDSPQSSSKNALSYKTTSGDYYYVLLTSLNNLYQNTIVAHFKITRPTFNLMKPVQACVNVTECTMPLSFGTSQTVVLEMPEEADWVADVGEVECVPRPMVYFPFYLAIPISILCFAFGGRK